MDAILSFVILMFTLKSKNSSIVSDKLNIQYPVEPKTLNIQNILKNQFLLRKIFEIPCAVDDSSEFVSNFPKLDSVEVLFSFLKKDFNNSIKNY
ncbi:hypothetical protein BpHYR1_033955 [Brachionus plicatilis]|uniref:Uncharacterized protein n=1 Tax=Brachionus plicatilis TaxID=10195 RepID=A0A3M7QBA9_BRAPC|nr:hypothetical protein BpHYR1_033955 [Brachionus plicatilis]